jgi:hypothetical protein
MIIFRAENERIDFRPKAQFYGWGYLVIMAACLIGILIAII